MSSTCSRRTSGRVGPDDARYSPRKFRVDKTMIGTVAKNVENVGAAIRFLAGLARALQRAGLLERHASRHGASSAS